MEKVEAQIRTQHGPFRMICYAPTTEAEPDFALIHGDISDDASVLVRIQSECITGHVLQSLTCDCYWQLQDALRRIVHEEAGVLIYLRQEGRGIGLMAKMRSYILQAGGLDTVEANLELGFNMDDRNYETAAFILRDLGITNVRMLTNNPEKVRSLEAAGMVISERVELPPRIVPANKRYITTKAIKMHHRIEIEQ